MRAIGHGIDVDEFSCSDAPSDERFACSCSGATRRRRASRRSCAAAARRGRATSRRTAPTPTFEAYKRSLARSRASSESAPSSAARFRAHEVPQLFARSHVLVNNMRAGAPDKVVYEAAASCVPVLASNPVFDDLLPNELRFERRTTPRASLQRLRSLDRRRRPELRDLVAAQPLRRATGPMRSSLRLSADETGSDTVLHLQKVAGISGSEAHLLSLLPRLRERGWDVRMLMLHENEPGAWDFARALRAARRAARCDSAARRLRPDRVRAARRRT